MKKFIVFFITIFLIFIASHPSSGKGVPFFNSRPLCFTENKGQIKDQYGCLRDDIQFALNGNGINIFIGSGQLHYQFCKTETCLPETSYSVRRHGANIQHQTETYRMDVELIGANTHAPIITEEQQEYREIYYITGCVENGIQANSFKKITYKNIYPNIDWVIVIAKNTLEHEFVVNAGGKVSDIRLKYSGQNSLMIDGNGSVIAATPLGTITELAPKCYNSDGNEVSSRFRIHNNVVSYNVNEYKGALIIDPVLEWGTYYGQDSSGTSMNCSVCDDSGHIYICGSTYSGANGTVATIGSYQSSIGGDIDAFIVKFDSSGNRLWGTYYGGSGGDLATGITLDHFGNIYVTGQTKSIDSIATSATQQPLFYGGSAGNNGFLTKFSISGVRRWGTYIGGSGASMFSSVSCDFYGHVYVSGVTEDTSHLATPGSFKPTKCGPFGDHSGSRDCFLIQYDSTGFMRWGTYYGGTQDDFGGVSCSDGVSVYLSGWSFSTDSIATVGSYQTVLGGISDAFLVKFDTAGHRLWGTYYGGEGQEIVGGITCDKNKGHIYLLGSTQSDTGIASVSCFQPLRGGLEDAFLAKFESISGFRLWGTYYGGPGTEVADNSRIVADKNDNVYITGSTNSTSGIASIGAWKGLYGGGISDAFLAKYNDMGIQQWSTYYGGSGDDVGYSCAFDGKSVYICGYTTSSDSIATVGSFLDSGGGLTYYFQGFLAKFYTPCIMDSITGYSHVCRGDSILLGNSFPSGLWSSNDTTVAIIGSTTGVVMGLSAGVFTITYAYSTDCFVIKSDTVKECHLNVPGIKNRNILIEIFPNPANDILTITADNKLTQITINNLMGQTVYSCKCDTEKVNVNVEQLPPGMYFIRINGVDVRQFIKK